MRRRPGDTGVQVLVRIGKRRRVRSAGLEKRITFAAGGLRISFVLPRSYVFVSPGSYLSCRAKSKEDKSRDLELKLRMIVARVTLSLLLIAAAVAALGHA